MNLTTPDRNLLGAAMSQMLDDKEIADIVSARDEVYDRFSKVFTVQAVLDITEAEMRAFLDFKENKHWSNLQRASAPIFENFESTKTKLSDLLDPTRSSAERLNSINEIKGMGHGIATAILHVSSPEQFGVWNGTSESAMKRLGVWPAFPRGSSVGGKYRLINDVLNKLRLDLRTDLWTLDTFFWYIDRNPSIIDGLNPTAKPKFSGREKSIRTLVYTVNDTVKRANGQVVSRSVKNKELRLSSYELEKAIRELLDADKNCCSVTGLPFEFEGEGNNTAMRPSLDRINSDGHYEDGNIQLVCRFINFWKMATDDGEFRELLKLCVEKAPALRMVKD